MHLGQVNSSQPLTIIQYSPWSRFSSWLNCW